jgi:uncharacterized protein YeaO (DUF488 family)
MGRAEAPRIFSPTARACLTGGNMIRTKRVYEPARPDDGARILVDRLWPRGIAKKSVKLDSWNKDVAPSNELRKSFHHDPARWGEFQKRYFAELDKNPEAWSPIVESARAGDVTLLYSAKDEEQNNAQVLKHYLESKIKK